MDEDFWDCSVCTYKNKTEAFKCRVCDTRKGTSTRKPRVTASFVAQQIASSFPPIPPLPPVVKYQKTGHNKRVKKRPMRFPRLRNIDRSSGREIEVTVDGITVLITDYKLLPKKSEPKPEPEQEAEAEPEGEISEPKSGDSTDTEMTALEEKPGTQKESITS